METSNTDYRVTGILCLALYVPTALAICIRIYLHAHYKSGAARVVFHIALLNVIIFNIPQTVRYIWFPSTELWIFTHVTGLYSTLLLNLTFSYICVEWADVAHTGHASKRPVAIRNGVLIANVGVVTWAVITCMSITSYPDTEAGSDEYFSSALYTSLVVVGSLIFIATTILLTIQGWKIRNRILQSQRFVTEEALRSSLVKLVVSIAVITITTWIRLLFNFFAVLGVRFFAEMSLLPYEVWSNLIPDVFPVICLLYLQRRIPRTATTSPTDPKNTQAIDAQVIRLSVV